MAEHWIDLTRVHYFDDGPRLCRRAVDWRRVESLEENTAKAEGEVKTVVAMVSGEHFGVSQTVDDIMAMTPFELPGPIGFGKSTHKDRH